MTKVLDRIYALRQMPVDCCPKGAPVLVSGGIAMLKTGGVWVSGMSTPPFTRPLNWTPEWWAVIPQENDPLPIQRSEPKMDRDDLNYLVHGLREEDLP